MLIMCRHEKSSVFGAMLCMFEDNEAVIKMINKGRSPTMRHVSRTHRVAFNWLFDRINLDTKIQNKYIDTKHQLADMLTKGNFTRDEWNNILHLFNIMHFSQFYLAISAQQDLLRPCRKSHNSKKDQDKMDDWLRNRNQCEGIEDCRSVSNSAGILISSKRMQEQKEENRIVAKSRPTATNLVISVPTSS